MPKTVDLVEATYEVVDDNHRKRTADYGKNPVIELLLNGSTIKVPNETRVFKLARYVKQYNLRVKTRRTKDGLIIWLEQKPTDEEVNQHDIVD
jgi:hypothetical protein